MRTDAALRQATAPPETTGAVGTTLSSRTVACVHGERFPTPSIARNWMSVRPSAEIARSAPLWTADHVAPASAEVRY